MPGANRSLVELSVFANVVSGRVKPVDEKLKSVSVGSGFGWVAFTTWILPFSSSAFEFEKVHVTFSPSARSIATEGLVTVVLPPFALVTPQNDGPRLPMVFDINMGVRRDDPTLRDEINAALSKLRPKIDAVLGNYGVPRADLPVEMQHAPVTDQLSPAP